MPESLPFIGGVEVPNLYAEQLSLERRAGIKGEYGVDAIVYDRLQSLCKIDTICNNLPNGIYSLDLSHKPVRGQALRKFLDDEDISTLDSRLELLLNDIQRHQAIFKPKKAEHYNVTPKDASGQFGEVLSDLVGLGVLKEMPSFSITEDISTQNYLDLTVDGEITAVFYFNILNESTNQVSNFACRITINRQGSNESIDNFYKQKLKTAREVHLKHKEDLSAFYKKNGKIKIQLVRDPVTHKKSLLHTMPIAKAIQEIDRRSKDK